MNTPKLRFVSAPECECHCHEPGCQIIRQQQAVKLRNADVLQIGTPWGDGTTSMSQCAIQPGETFIYRFFFDRDVPQYTSLALQVVSSNIYVVVYLASLSLTISSLIDTIVAFAKANRSSTSSNQLVSFLNNTSNSGVPEDYIERAVIRGSNFWSLWIRAYYFAFPLLLWITGPIAMFVCSLGMISFLYFLDFTANPIPAFGIKPTSKHLGEPVYDIGRGIESRSRRKHVILRSPVELGE